QLGPLSSGETTLKQRQFEYDGAGRLASVCEITGGAGSYTCGQANPKTGYWTRYQYDSRGNLTGVCQYTTVASGTDCVAHPSTNQQTRTMTYDGMGRVLTQTTPERGTTQFFYDIATSSAPKCTSPQSGKLLAVIGPDGTTSCYVYDAIGRISTIT